MSSDVTPVFVDADPGMGVPRAPIDDNLAVLMALFSGDLDCRMVSVVRGNTEVETGGRSLTKTLRLADRGVPCALGAPGALLRTDRPTARVLFERSGSGELSLPERVGEEDPGVEDPNAVCELVRRLEETRRPLTLVALGPLTNIALLLRQRPDLGSSIERILVMGGAIEVPGNVTPLAEFNFWADPEAARIVFESAVPKLMVGLDVTHQVEVPLGEIERHVDTGNSLGTFVLASVRAWVSALNGGAGNHAVHPHDPVALSYLIEPELFETTPMRVEVEPGTGRSLGVRTQTGETSVATGIESDGFKRLFFEFLEEI